jgi:hypothetical protein
LLRQLIWEKLDQLKDCVNAKCFQIDFHERRGRVAVSPKLDEPLVSGNRNTGDTVFRRDSSNVIN